MLIRQIGFAYLSQLDSALTVLCPKVKVGSNWARIIEELGLIGPQLSDFHCQTEIIGANKLRPLNYCCVFICFENVFFSENGNLEIQSPLGLSASRSKAAADPLASKSQLEVDPSREKCG